MAWRIDPTGRHETRWNNGQRWTEHVGHNGTMSTDPYEAGDGETNRPTVAPPTTAKLKSAATTRKVWAWIGAAVLAMIVIGAVAGGDKGDDGGSGSGSSSLSQAFCNDLEDGLSVFQIWQGVRDQYTASEFADRAYGFAAISCPEQLQTNDGLRGYLEGWGIDPDA